jgi:pilus assembly protein Flp/PilA
MPPQHVLCVLDEIRLECEVVSGSLIVIYHCSARGVARRFAKIPLASVAPTLSGCRCRRTHMKGLLITLVCDDGGQDLVEYAFLITFIALACIIAMQQLGTAISNKYQSISTSLQSGS